MDEQVSTAISGGTGGRGESRGNRPEVPLNIKKLYWKPAGTQSRPVIVPAFGTDSDFADSSFSSPPYGVSHRTPWDRVPAPLRIRWPERGACVTLTVVLYGNMGIEIQRFVIGFLVDRVCQ